MLVGVSYNGLEDIELIQLDCDYVSLPLGRMEAADLPNLKECSKNVKTIKHSFEFYGFS
jgi:hypothetical protein